MKNIQLMLALLFTAACGRQASDVAPIAGPSFCSSFDFEETRLTARKNEISAIRGMRNYYAECVIRGGEKELLYWARLAAEHGNEKDKEEYAAIRQRGVN